MLATPQTNTPAVPPRSITQIVTSLVGTGGKMWLSIILPIVFLCLFYSFYQRYKRNAEIDSVATINYGELLTISVKPNYSVKVNLTNDWDPIYSSGKIDVYNKAGIKRTYERYHFISGPIVEGQPNEQFKFTNTGKTLVTVKIGRYDVRDLTDEGMNQKIQKANNDFLTKTKN